MNPLATKAMTLLFVAFVIPFTSPPADWIDSVRLSRENQETSYRIVIGARDARPLSHAFHSFDPPNVYTISAPPVGPCVILHGFDPQADFLTVFAYRSGKWQVSETLYARYGFEITQRRKGQLSIATKFPRQDKSPLGTPPWIRQRYRVVNGSLVEASR